MSPTSEQTTASRQEASATRKELTIIVAAVIAIRALAAIRATPMLTAATATVPRQQVTTLQQTRQAGKQEGTWFLKTQARKQTKLQKHKHCTYNNQISQKSDKRLRKKMIKKVERKEKDTA
jgi:hypothetical protein